MTIVLASAGSAQAVWFGAADMSLPANVGFTCAGYPLYGLYPTGATSCTWYTIALFGETNPRRSNIVPKGVGFVTAFRVRTGPSTGQMRLTILKSLRAYANAGETACCTGDDESATVSPPPNAITTYSLARPIPVYNGPESSTIESFDSIAISLLDLRSTVPANLSSTYVTGAALFGHVQKGQERFGQGIVVNPYTGMLNLPTGELAARGYQVLLQADWEPQAGVTVTTSSVRVHNGAALIPLACKLDEACRGILRLQNAKATGAIAARTLTTYGTAKFVLAAGQRRSVKLTLAPAGRALMSQYRSRFVWANTSFSLHSRQLTIAHRTTLHR